MHKNKISLLIFLTPPSYRTITELLYYTASSVSFRVLRLLAVVHGINPDLRWIASPVISETY